MKLNAIFAFLHQKFKKLPDYGRVIALFLLFLMSYVFLNRLIDWFKNFYHQEPEPHLIREHGYIKVPLHSPIRKVLEVMELKPCVKPIELTFPAVIETNDKRDVQIFTPMEGRLIKIPVKLGQLVNKGDVLAIIRSPTLAQLNSDYLTAKSLVNLNTQLLKRAMMVNQAGANSKKDVEVAQNNLNSANAQLRSLTKKIKILGENKYSIFYLRAPYKSYVTNIHLGVGTYVSSLETTLMTLNSIEKVWLTTAIPEDKLRFVQPTQKVFFSLDAYPNQKFEGQVTFISPRMNPESRSNSTRITIVNPDASFKPEMFAQAHVIIPQQSKIILPTSAILMDYESTSVFLEVSPWVFQRTNVELGYEHEGLVEIISGLKFGDRVATKGGIFIND